MRDLACYHDIQCLHDWQVTGIDGSWIKLRCEKCGHDAQVEHSRITYAKYCAIPYLLEEQTDLTDQAKKDMEKFIKNNKQLITDLLRLEKIDAELLDNVFATNSQIMQERATHVQEAIKRIESEG